MPKTPEKPPFSVVSAVTTTIPEPPRQLGPHGFALWIRIQTEYGIADSGGCELLCLAAAELDRAEGLAEAIARDGAVIHTRAGMPRSHPACRDELAARAFVVKTLEKLGVTTEGIKPGPGHPPRPTSWIPPR